MSTSTPLTFTVTHICEDQVTDSGKTKVLLMCDAVDKMITLSTLIDLGMFNPAKPLAKWHRLVTDSFKFEDVETDYVAEDGSIVALKKPRQTVWLNGTVRRQAPAPIAPTVIIDEFDDAPATVIIDDAF
jgi:hypothetical protein